MFIHVSFLYCFDNYLFLYFVHWYNHLIYHILNEDNDNYFDNCYYCGCCGDFHDDCHYDVDHCSSDDDYCYDNVHYYKFCCYDDYHCCDECYCDDVNYYDDCHCDDCYCDNVKFHHDNLSYYYYDASYFDDVDYYDDCYFDYSNWFSDDDY